MTTTGYRESGWRLQMFLECLPCARFQARRQILQIKYRSVGLSIVKRKQTQIMMTPWVSAMEKPQWSDWDWGEWAYAGKKRFSWREKMQRHASGIETCFLGRKLCELTLMWDVLKFNILSLFPFLSESVVALQVIWSSLYTAQAGLQHLTFLPHTPKLQAYSSIPRVLVPRVRCWL